MDYYKLVIDGSMVTTNRNKIINIAKAINKEFPDVVLDLETWDNNPEWAPTPPTCTHTQLDKNLKKEL